MKILTHNDNKAVQLSHIFAISWYDIIWTSENFQFLKRSEICDTFLFDVLRLFDTTGDFAEFAHFISFFMAKRCDRVHFFSLRSSYRLMPTAVGAYVHFLVIT